MIVSHDDHSSIAGKRVFDNLPWVDRGVRERAAKQLSRFDEVVPRAQVQHDEDLVVQARAVQAQPIAQGLR